MAYEEYTLDYIKRLLDTEDVNVATTVLNHVKYNDVTQSQHYKFVNLLEVVTSHLTDTNFCEHEAFYKLCETIVIEMSKWGKSL